MCKTVFVTSVVYVLQVLSRDSTRCLNAQNEHGETALHLACRGNKPECVKALLLAGADVNITAGAVVGGNESSPTSPPGYVGDFLQDHPNKLYTEDMKLGGTPLHWSSSREVIDILVRRNCNVNAPNFEGSTALHVMVQRGRLECAVALLSHGADVDARDARGDTPLHVATRQGGVHNSITAIVQALLVFGSNLNSENELGVTARHLLPAGVGEQRVLHYLHAVGARRCTPNVVGCTDGCRHDGQYNGEAPPPVQGPHNRAELDDMLSAAGMQLFMDKRVCSTEGGRLLCLDGGGQYTS